MARQKLSAEEQRRRNREYQRKRREKIYSQQETKDSFLKQERQRWKKRVQNGNLRQIGDLNEREKRHQRRAWKHFQKKVKRAQESTASRHTSRESTRPEYGRAK